jgi:hypothetical protein
MKAISARETAIRQGCGVALAALALLLLTGCEGVKRDLGLSPTPPDEFSVVTKAPLVLPPDFSLRPPEPGAARPNALSPRTAAQAALIGSNGQAGTSGPSQGEQALLTLAGAQGIDPNIRSTVNQETVGLIEDSTSFGERLMFWQDPSPYGSVVDPAKEVQRLRENAATGKTVAEGDTPTIKRRRKAPLEGLFN